MTEYFGLWRLNRNIQPPPTPDAQIMQLEGFSKMIKTELRKGRIKQAHEFIEGGAGYFIYDGTEEQLLEDLLL